MVDDNNTYVQPTTPSNILCSRLESTRRGTSSSRYILVDVHNFCISWPFYKNLSLTSDANCSSELAKDPPLCNEQHRCHGWPPPNTPHTHTQHILYMSWTVCGEARQLLGGYKLLTQLSASPVLDGTIMSTWKESEGLHYCSDRTVLAAKVIEHLRVPDAITRPDIFEFRLILYPSSTSGSNHTLVERAKVELRGGLNSGRQRFPLEISLPPSSFAGSTH